MKKTILNLGHQLNKKEQKKIKGSANLEYEDELPGEGGCIRSGGLCNPTTTRYGKCCSGRCNGSGMYGICA